MNDVNAKVKANNNLKQAKSKADEETRSEQPAPEFPGLAIPFAFRGLAEASMVRAKENSEKISAVSVEMTGVLRESYLTTSRGAADYGTKVVEIASANARSAFDFVGDLMTTKSMSEIVQLSTAQARKNIDAAYAQNTELWELAQKIAIDSAEPIKQGVSKALQKVT